MPLTFPAHQVPVLPLKIWRPRWFDGTALVVGAAAPDLQQAAPWFEVSSHSWSGVFVFSLPFTIIYCTLFRRYAAAGLFGSLPDLGPLRLRSYRVLAARSPAFGLTALSALLGASSHVAIDSFTHKNRWGSNTLGLSGELFDSPRGIFTTARILQYFGHTIGSLIGLAVFIAIAGRHLEQWYGSAETEAARSEPTAPNGLRTTLAVLAGSMVVAVGWLALQQNALFFVLGLCAVLGLLLAGAINQLRTKSLNAAPTPP